MNESRSEQSGYTLTRVEDYESLVGAEAVERILRKAGQLRDLHVVNVNSTYYGGGVAEILSSLTLLMNSAGSERAGASFRAGPTSLRSPRRCTTPCRAALST